MWYKIILALILCFLAGGLFAILIEICNDAAGVHNGPKGDD